VVCLTEVFRQAAASRIIVNAHRINQGVIPDLRNPDTESDFYFLEADDPETAVGINGILSGNTPMTLIRA
jgi:exodeoxyribonuclease V alpha subunit